MNYARPNLTQARWKRLKKLCKELGYTRWGNLLDKMMDYADANLDFFHKL